MFGSKSLAWTTFCLRVPPLSIRAAGCPPPRCPPLTMHVLPPLASCPVLQESCIATLIVHSIAEQSLKQGRATQSRTQQRRGKQRRGRIHNIRHMCIRIQEPSTYSTPNNLEHESIRIQHLSADTSHVLSAGTAYSTSLRILHICCLQDPHTGQRLYPAPVGGYCPHPCITWLPLERRTAAPPPDRRSAVLPLERRTRPHRRPTRGWQHCRLRRGRPHRRPTGGRQHCHSRGGRLHRRPTGGWPHRHLTGGRPHHHPTGGWPSPEKHACIDASTS